MYLKVCRRASNWVDSKTCNTTFRFSEKRRSSLAAATTTAPSSPGQKATTLVGNLHCLRVTLHFRYTLFPILFFSHKCVFFL